MTREELETLITQAAREDGANDPVVIALGAFVCCVFESLEQEPEPDRFKCAVELWLMRLAERLQAVFELQQPGVLGVGSPTIINQKDTTP